MPQPVIPAKLGGCTLNLMKHYRGGVLPRCR